MPDVYPAGETTDLELAGAIKAGMSFGVAAVGGAAIGAVGGFAIGSGRGASFFRVARGSGRGDRNGKLGGAADAGVASTIGDPAAESGGAICFAKSRAELTA